MTAWVLGVVLAAGSGFSAAGAVTTGFDVTAWEGSQLATGSLHGHLALRQELGRVWFSAEGSVLLTPRASPLSDLGSNLTIGYQLDGFVKALRLEVTPFFLPMSRRASFDWLGNWVTDAVAPFGPTLAGEITTTAGSAWVAVHFKRPALEMTPNPAALTTHAFLGLDVSLPASLRLELRGAWVHYRDNLGVVSQLTGEELSSLGGAGRLSWTWNDEVGAMVDFFDYAADPTRFTRFAALERRRTPRAAQVFLEGGVVGQRLADPSRFGAMTTQVGGWLDGQGRLRLGDVRLFATARLQSAEHVLAPAQELMVSALEPNLERIPAVEGRVGADVTLGRSKVTPGLLVSVLRPAAVRWNTGQIRIPATFSLLPPDARVEPVVTTRASVRWDPAPFVALVTELALSSDPNHFVVRDSIEFQGRTLAPLIFRAQLFAQGRF